MNDDTFIDRSLEDLDLELAAGDLSAADHERLRTHYEQLRTSAPTPSRSLPYAWIAAALVAALVVGFAVARFAGERLPSQTVTGSTNDVASTLAEARGLLGTDRKAAARKFADVIAAQPNNAEARTYAAWIRRLDARESGDASQYPIADAELERAAVADPRVADPHCFRAVLKFRDLADAPASYQELRACRSLNPNQQVLALVSNLSTEVDAALVGSADSVVSGLAKARAIRDAPQPTKTLEAYAAVLATDPKNVEARVWRSYVLARAAVDAGRRKLLPGAQVASVLDTAVTTLDGVLADSPDADASCAKSIILSEQGRAADAQAALDGCRNGIATPELRAIATA